VKDNEKDQIESPKVSFKEDRLIKIYIKNEEEEDKSKSAPKRSRSVD